MKLPNSHFRIPAISPEDKDVPEIEPQQAFVADPESDTVKKLAKLIGWDKVRELAEPTPKESTAHLVQPSPRSTINRL